VHAADAAGAEEPDAGRPAGGERSAHGRRADSPLGDCCSEVAWPDLARLGREPLQLGVREADPECTVEHADGRRHRTRCTDTLRRLDADGHALARREPVRNERRLERDDGRAPPQRIRDLGRDLDHGIAPSWATQRAAA